LLQRLHFSERAYDGKETRASFWREHIALRSAANSKEQSAGLGQINGAMGQLNKVTQQNASASEELAATAEEMGGQVTQLQDLMAFFKINAK
jgi:methyl-accepting chemotaxis protein